MSITGMAQCTAHLTLEILRAEQILLEHVPEVRSSTIAPRRQDDHYEHWDCDRLSRADNNLRHDRVLCKYHLHHPSYCDLEVPDGVVKDVASEGKGSSYVCSMYFGDGPRIPR